MAPNSHAENGVTLNRKMSNMRSKCAPEGVPKTDQKATSNGNLRFWTRSGESAWPPPVVLAPDRCMRGRMPAKRAQTGWSIRLEWHTGVTCEVVLAHRSAFSTQRPWNHPLQASFFGHHWMACDHPCALVPGVGPCLHL